MDDLTANRPPIVVDVWSDIACPWCFIGRRRFQAAVTEFRTRHGGRVEVRHHSYQLSPETPVDYAGSQLQFLIQRKDLPAAEARSTLRQLTEVAATVGLAYDFEALQPTNTLLAHQLLHFARDAGVEGATWERLFRAYFEQGRHVGRVDELVALGAEVGLDPAQLRAALTDGRYVTAVLADQSAAADAGVSGVPFHLVDGRHAVRGAAEPAEFLAALEAAYAD